jgi:hypothetical protein
VNGLNNVPFYIGAGREKYKYIQGRLSDSYPLDSSFIESINVPL